MANQNLINAGLTAVPVVGGLASQAIANQQNKKLAKYSYEQDLQQWHRSNLYNSPSAQMGRLKEAGLNPNLVYGNGAVGNTSGGSPSYNTPEYRLDTKGIGADPMAILGQTQQIEQSKATTDNIRAQENYTKMKAFNESFETAILQKQAEKMGISINEAQIRLRILMATAPEQEQQIKTNLAISKQGLEGAKQQFNQQAKLNPYQAEILKNQSEASKHSVAQAISGLRKQGFEMSEIKARTKGIKQDTLVKRQEEIFKKYENFWRSKGITSSDNVMIRLFAETIGHLGMTAEVGLEHVIDKINQTTGTGDYK